MRNSGLRATGGRSLAWLLLLVVSLAGCTPPADDSWEQIRETGVLRIGLDPTYPPFENADGEELRGFDVDLARALAAELGLEVQFAYIAYDGLYDALATGRVDVLISALVIRPEQMKDFAYSDPYFNAGQVLLVPAGEQEIADMADLSGRNLAVELGSQGHYEATQWQRRIRDLSIETFNSPDETLDAVVAGRAAAGLVDSISGRLYLREHDTLRLAGPPVTVEPFAMVVRIEDERLLEAINKSLEELEEDGRIEQIRDRWLYSQVLFSLFL